MDLAVIGVGCHYPGSTNSREFWENVLCKRQQFRKMLDQRLPLDEYYDADKSVPDKLYARRAAYIDDFNFDWARRRIPQKTVQGTDIVQWLALQTAEQAILDAGYDRETLSKDKTGVILGNSLTGEQTRSNNMRLRWPYVEKTMRRAAQSMGLDAAQMQDYINTCEEIYKSVFPPVDEDTLQGGLSNTIAGRVANYFDLHGGGYVVDGACSSSLLAVCTAATYLESGDIDIALAGGVDVSLDTFELIGFAKTGALSIDDMSVYDRRAKGFIPGEGSGFVVMKRLDDALAAGDTVYAVVKGWGISSDGKGGITAPSDVGQSKALIRAYEKAGYTPANLDFIEGHGTGTPRGDVTELKGIAKAFEHFDVSSQRSCGITSLKSILGHTKAAAGIGAFIKTVIAVNQRVIPPTAGCQTPNEAFDADVDMLFPAIRGSVSEKEIISAGVSAMGFGGINTHVTLQSSPDFAPIQKWQSALSAQQLLASSQNTELLLFSASSKQALLDHLNKAEFELRHMSVAELADFSAHLAASTTADSAIKAAILATHPENSAAIVQELIQQISSNTTRNKTIWVSPDKQAFWSENVIDHPLSFAFPGQGSQRINSAKKLFTRLDWAQDLLAKADKIALKVLGQALSPLMFPEVDHFVTKAESAEAKEQLMATQFAQPIICLTSLVIGKYLQSLGVQPKQVFGHSLGELSALHFAGVFSEESLIKLACLRGLAMSKAKSGGTMASIGADETVVADLINNESGYVAIANLNSPEQTIISGDKATIEKVVKRAKKQRLSASLLPVAGAFHSEYVASSAKRFKTKIDKVLKPAVNAIKLNDDCDYYSSTTGEKVQQFDDIADYLSQQIVQKVDFISLLKNIGAISDSILEIGSGRVLSGLMSQIGDLSQFIGTTGAEENSETDLLQVLAYCHITGNIAQAQNISAGRFTREYKSFAEKQFIENPCEREPVIPEGLPRTDASISPSNDMKFFSSEANSQNGHGGVHDALSMFDRNALDHYFNERGPFISQVISADMVARPAGQSSLSVQSNSVASREITPSHTKPNVTPNLAKAQESTIKPEGLQTTTSANTGVGGVAAANIVATTESVRAVILTEIATATGFNEADINESYRLLDDLNLDSIKSGQLILSLKNKLNYTPELDSSAYANSAISELIDLFAEPNDAAIAVVSNVDTEPAVNTRVNIEQTIHHEISLVTGFPTESLSDDLRLLDDLNLDSIKAGQLLNKLKNDLLPEASMDNVDAAQYANAAILELVDLFTAEQGVAVAMGTAVSDVNAPLANVGVSELDIEQFFIAQVAEVTGFAAESITTELRLLDDLNIDSIKSAQIINTTLGHFDVSGELDAASLANETVANIVNQTYTLLAKETPQLASATVAAAKAVSNTPPPTYLTAKNENWVHAYQLEYLSHDTNLSKQTVQDVSIYKQAVLVGAEKWVELADNITKELVSSDVEIVAYADVASGQKMLGDHAIFILLSTVEKTAKNKGSVATLASACDDLTQAIQLFHNSGAKLLLNINTGFDPDINRAQQAQSVSGFLRSCSLEHPDLGYKSVCFTEGVAPEDCLKWLFSETQVELGYDEVLFDVDGQKYIPLITPINTNQQQTVGLNIDHEAQDLSSDDVILVTGGGKGITAECAIALAQKIDSRFILMGRTPLETDNKGQASNASSQEIVQTLEGIRKAGNQAEYIACDLTDQDNLKTALLDVQNVLGKITALVHGAGLNHARPVDTVSSEAAYREIATKVEGFDSIIEIIGDNDIKLIVSFTSIIGVAGMPGNAWYAFSNGLLNYATQHYQNTHPKTRTISLAYSVWGEVGMGHRMGVVDSLSQAGIGYIPTAEGIHFFLQAVQRAGVHQQWVISGAMTGLETWKTLSRVELLQQKFRFLESITDYELGQHCVAQVRLNVEEDRYLNDHDFRGSLLFPTVMALEAMSEVAQIVAGFTCQPTSMRNISLTRPIVVDAGAGEEVQLVAELVPVEEAANETIVHVALYCASSAFKTPHFAADLVYTDEPVLTSKTELLIEDKLPLSPQHDLYGEHLFQGELFQRLQSIYHYHQKSITFSVAHQSSLSGADNGFSANNEFHLLLGDPFYRDTLLQIAQLPASPKVVLPLEIGEICFTENNSLGLRYGVATLTQVDDKDYLWDVAVFDESGYLLETLTDYRVRTVNGPDGGGLSVQQLLDKQAATNVTDLAEGIREGISALGYQAPQLLLKPVFELGKESQAIRAQIEIALINSHQAFDDKLAWSIRKDAAGKPELFTITGEFLPISISHNQDFLFSAIGVDVPTNTRIDKSNAQQQGCDIEAIETRSLAEWQGLLGKRCEDIFRHLMLMKNVEQDIAGTLLWTVSEASAKYLQGWDFNVTNVFITEQFYCFDVSAGNQQIEVLSLVNINTSTPFALSVVTQPLGQQSKHVFQQNN